MDIQTLLNSLTADGFQVTPHGTEGVAILGPTESLTPTLRTAIREHKGTLRQLACIPVSYVVAEREAIIWADTFDADTAIEAALADWDSLSEPSHACDTCGSSLFRFDVQGNRHCIRCNPGQSQRVRELAECIRERADKTLPVIHNKQDASGVETRDASNQSPLTKKGGG